MLSEKDKWIKRLGQLCVYIAKAEANVNYDFWSYGVMLDGGLLEYLADEMISKWDTILSDVDYVCSIPASGIALGTLIQHKKRLPQICFRRAFHPEIPSMAKNHISEGCKVVLLDICVNTGSSYQIARTILRNLGREIRFPKPSLLVAVYNDCSQVEAPAIKEMLEQKEFQYLYKASEIVQILGLAP